MVGAILSLQPFMCLVMSESDKQKVTLYFEPTLYDGLKVMAAVHGDTMSAIAARAVAYYIEHADVVEGTMGHTHQVHNCGQCGHPFVIRHGKVYSLPQATVLDDEAVSKTVVAAERLVTC